MNSEASKPPAAKPASGPSQERPPAAVGAVAGLAGRAGCVTCSRCLPKLLPPPKRLA